jgi:hypothetical protein
MLDARRSRVPPPFDPFDRWLVRAVALSTVALVVVMVILPFVLDESMRSRLYGDERSPVERTTFWSWIALAVALPVVVRSLSTAVLAGSAVCLAFAAREADWHKLFTGYSVLKPKFYVLPEHPWTTRLVAALVVAVAIVAAWIALRALWRAALGDGGVAAAWVRIGAIVAALAIGTKAVDRLPQIVGSFGIDVPTGVRLSFKSFEELGEFLLPFLLLAVAILFARLRRRECDALTSGRSAGTVSASAG